MYESLKGMKLLVIGSAETDTNIVNAAHELGIYVIVADGTKKSERTFAKNAADESWDIDYSDTEALAEKCKQAGVNGVMAGYSEFRVCAACKLSKALGTPFYATEEQIELTRSKLRFKEECKRYGIKTPAYYRISDSSCIEDTTKLRFPVIVKPADAAGRKGISVCDEPSQLESAIKNASAYSVSNTVIVEEYIVGKEFSAIYTIKNGECSLSCVYEKWINSEARSSGLCDLDVSPSRLLDRYIESCDQSVKTFIAGMGMENGAAFFQGIAAADGLYIFEMGYRLNGGNHYYFIEKENGISYLKMLIAHSLTGNMEGDLNRDDPRFSRYYANYLIYSHAGTIADIAFAGDEDRPGLEQIHIRRTKGMTIKEDGSTLQCAFTYKLCAASLDELAELIRYCRDNSVIVDQDGRSMMFEPFDTQRLY